MTNLNHSFVGEKLVIAIDSLPSSWQTLTRSIKDIALHKQVELHLVNIYTVTDKMAAEISLLHHALVAHGHNLKVKGVTELAAKLLKQKLPNTKLDITLKG